MNRYLKMIPAAYLLKKLPYVRDDLLYGMGLQRRQPGMIAAQALAVFGTGCLVGAGFALLFAPRPGRQLRQQLSDKAAELRHKASDKVLNAAQTADRGVENVAYQSGSIIR